MSQKPDMMVIHASNRGSKMLVTVRHNTWKTDSVFDAPEGTSLKVSRSNRLNEVKNAEAKNKLRQASLERSPASRKPGSEAPSVSIAEGKKCPTKAPTFTTQ